MFKSIRNSLDRRQQTIGTQSLVADITQQAVSSFLQQTYNDTSARVSVRYKETDRTLTIITTSKTLAGELLLHIPELRTYLASQGVSAEHIVVR